MRLPAVLVLAGLMVVAPSQSFAQDPVPPPAASSQDVPLDYVFGGNAGMLFFHVHLDRAVEFERIARQIGELLGVSEDPIRRQQAAGWKLFRSLETHPNRVYVFLFDPVVAGADYDPVKILSSEVPEEVQSLYAELNTAIIRIERMSLIRVR